MQDKLSRNKIADYKSTVMGLACLLPFLVLFSIGQNIDVQALVLIMMGAVAYYGLWLERKISLPRYASWLIVVYVAFCFVSLLAHPTFDNLFGTRLVRLGSLALVACVGCGVLLCTVTAKRLLLWLYGTCTLLAIITLPYTFLTAHHLSRIGGVFHQADFLAVWMASGIILGVAMWQTYPKYKRYIILCQLLLIGILFLSQTRAVIIVLVILLLAMAATASLGWQLRLALALGIAGVLTAGGILSQAVLSKRLTNATYAGQSVSYRLDLEKAGLGAATKQPLWGFGAGGIPNALSCPHLHSTQLQKTCREGFYFDSSHNIFLDRVIALGWIGGVAYIGIIGLALYKGLCRTGIERIYTYGALLIGVCYLTNVTSLTLELLFWVLLMRAFTPKLKT